MKSIGHEMETIKQVTGLTEKKLNDTRNNCLQARVQLELRSGSHLSLFNGKLKTDLAAFLHGYPRPTNRQICQ
mgnify:CR=1 FL=1